jgi:hypothetical protein
MFSPHDVTAVVGSLSRLVPALLLLLAGASCSTTPPENRKPVFPVRGQVFVQDKPAVGAFVLLIPLHEPAQPIDPRPRGQVENDGSFTLSTYDANDGAPAGDYVVTITWPGGEDPEDKLLGRYSDRARSKLRATVRAGPNELPPFRLR